MQIKNIKPEISRIPLEIPEEQPPEGPSSYPKSLEKLFKNRASLEWETATTGFHGGPHGKRKAYVLSLWSLMASTIDALLLIAMSCVFLMAFIKIIKTPLTPSVLKDFAVIYVIVSWLYMITLRFFIGSSIGEAACDLRLGRPQDRSAPGYFAKVVFRATLVVATGLVVLPLLSLVFGRDLAGSLSGLKLFSLK